MGSDDVGCLTQQVLPGVQHVTVYHFCDLAEMQACLPSLGFSRHVFRGAQVGVTSVGTEQDAEPPRQPF